MELTDQQKQFKALYESDKNIQKILSKKDVTMDDIYKYAESLGNIKSKIIKDVLSEIDITDPENRDFIFKTIIGEIDGSAKMINDLYIPYKKDSFKKAGITFKPDGLTPDKSRVGGIVTHLLNRDVEQVPELTAMQIVQNHLNLIDEAERKNLTVALKAGLRATVTRTRNTNKKCSWCDERCGTYEMSVSPGGKINWDNNLFARHDGCTCTIKTTVENPNGTSKQNTLAGINYAKRQKKQHLDDMRQYAREIGINSSSIENMGVDKLREAINARKSRYNGR